MQDGKRPQQLDWKVASVGGNTEGREAQSRAAMHKLRCRSLPPVGAGEAERLVARFLAERGGATRCPPAYAAPVGQPLR